MDLIWCRKLCICHADRNDSADLLQLSCQKSGTFFSRLLVVLGICSFNLHAARCNYGTDFGAIADVKNLKKKLFELFLLLGVFGCAMLGFVPSCFFFLIGFILTNTGYSASLIFYDAMLTDVTKPQRMDTVSSQGSSWGYIGSCVTFTIGLAFVLFASELGISLQKAMTIAFVITALVLILNELAKKFLRRRSLRFVSSIILGFLFTPI